MTFSPVRQIRTRVIAPLSRPAIRNGVLLVAFGMVIFLLWESDDPGSLTTDVMELRGESEPDSFINDGIFLSFDQQGERQIVVSSPRMEQFEDRREVLIEQPDATLFDRATDLRWELTASEGLLYPDTETMDLTGDVRVVRQVTGGEAVLLTEYLRIDNPARRISTDQPVVMESPGTVTRARGLTGWMDDRVLELDNTVEGIYETRP